MRKLFSILAASLAVLVCLSSCSKLDRTLNGSYHTLATLSVSGDESVGFLFQFDNAAGKVSFGVRESFYVSEGGNKDYYTESSYRNIPCTIEKTDKKSGIIKISGWDDMYYENLSIVGFNTYRLDDAGNRVDELTVLSISFGSDKEVKTGLTADLKDKFDRAITKLKLKGTK